MSGKHEIRKRKTNWISHILRRNCLLKQVIKEKIKGEMEVTRRRGRRRKKLLDDRRTGEDSLIWRRKLCLWCLRVLSHCLSGFLVPLLCTYCTYLHNVKLQFSGCLNKIAVYYGGRQLAVIMYDIIEVSQTPYQAPVQFFTCVWYLVGSVWKIS